MISKKTRNMLFARVGILFLGCTVILGFASPQTTKAEDKKVKKVIYLIADGMSDSSLTAGNYYKDAQDGVLGNDRLTMYDIRTGYAKTTWAGGPITDSAPSATALSSGYKTNPGVVGLDTNGAPKATLLEAAKINGLATGIISTSDISHATPASFSAHAQSRNDYNTIMKQQLYKDMDVILGGGSLFFGETGGGKRKDGKDLIKDIKSFGYDYVTTKDKMKESKSNKLWGFFAENDLAYDLDRVSLNKTDEPTLAEMTNKAIETLEKDKDGFFLMIEGSKVDWAAHANDPAGMVGDIVAFDDAVKVAVDYAKKNQDTIVIVTTDHANSGFSIGNESTSSGYDDLTFADSVMQMKDFKLSAESFTSLAKGKSDEEVISLIKKYYGYSNITADELAFAKDGKINEVMKIRAKIGYTTTGHTGGDVYFGIFAPAGVAKLRGTVDNTELARYAEKNLGLNLASTSDLLYKDLKATVEKAGATFELNKSDVENPYFLIKKDTKTLKVIANSNLVEVTVGDKKAESKKLSSVSVLSGDKAYGNGDEIVKILNEKPIDENGNGGTGGTGTGGNTGTGGSGSVDKPNKLPQTGTAVGGGLLALLGAGSIGAGVYTLKRRKKE